MQIKTKTQINTSTFDGRAVSADEAAVIEIDDDDAGMIGLAKSLISSGQAEFYGDAGAVDDSEPGGEGTEPEAELDHLREQAEAAGVKVDGRWGADRLREEIEAAASAAETEN